MINVLVTGGNGQLGRCIKDLESQYGDLNLIYRSSLQLDICDLNQVNKFFQDNTQIHYCVTYAAVDYAEEYCKKAYNTNFLGVKNLASICEFYNIVLIHVSTDFVFDGKSEAPYRGDCCTKLISVYGDSKLGRENEIRKRIKPYFIIRTSRLYSEHGSNFLETMLKLSKKKNEISIVCDQIGTPTYAGDLVKVIMDIIRTKSQNYGSYDYSNLGELSWFNFSKTIFEECNITIELNKIETKDYSTFAKRPKYSVLDKSEIKNIFRIENPHWRDSLKRALIKFK